MYIKLIVFVPFQYLLPITGDYFQLWLQQYDIKNTLGAQHKNGVIFPLEVIITEVISLSIALSLSLDRCIVLDIDLYFIL